MKKRWMSNMLAWWFCSWYSASTVSPHTEVDLDIMSTVRDYGWGIGDARDFGEGSNCVLGLHLIPLTPPALVVPPSAASWAAWGALVRVLEEQTGETVNICAAYGQPCWFVATTLILITHEGSVIPVEFS